MKVYDFDKYPQNENTYSGMSGRKVGITVNGINYLIKIHEKILEKERDIEHDELDR